MKKKQSKGPVVSAASLSRVRAETLSKGSAVLVLKIWMENGNEIEHFIKSIRKNSVNILRIFTHLYNRMSGYNFIILAFLICTVENKANLFGIVFSSTWINKFFYTFLGNLFIRCSVHMFYQKLFLIVDLCILFKLLFSLLFNQIIHYIIFAKLGVKKICLMSC